MNARLWEGTTTRVGGYVRAAQTPRIPHDRVEPSRPLLMSAPPAAGSDLDMETTDQASPP